MSGFLIGPCGVAPAVVLGGGGPTLSFIAKTVYTPTNDPNTVASVAIGTASANRRVIIAATISRVNPVTAISFNVGGGPISCTLFGPTLNNATYNGQVVFGYADVPTGTTATVVITGGDQSGDLNQDSFYIYTVDKSTLVNGSPTYSGNAISNASPSASNTNNTTATSANGFVITALALPGLSGATSMSVTASTPETFTLDDFQSGGQNVSACASKISGSSSSAGTSVTWGWTTSAGSVVGVFAWA